MKLITIVGARPQFVKAAAVSRAIKRHNKTLQSGDPVNEVIIHTGQHFDENMSEVFFRQMQIPKPDYNLDINGLSHGAMTGRMLESIEKVLTDETPDMMMVYGDTNSTLAGALAASKLHIPVAHVEAGLRSHNRKMPEEVNRVLTDHVSSVLFCPTREAVINLEGEGIVSGDGISVVLSGDVMLDAACFYRDLEQKPGTGIPRDFILATVHRAENTDDPSNLRRIFGALEEIGRDLPVIIPLHPRTAGLLSKYGINVSSEGLIPMDPVSYLEMVYLLDRCRLVMTDSGGIQKEAFFFGKPCITLREETEWVELVDNKVNILAGSDPERILTAFEHMKNTHIPSGLSLYGEGKAAENIVQTLVNL